MVLLEFHGFSLDTEAGFLPDLTHNQPILQPDPPPHTTSLDSYQHLKLDPAANHHSLFHAVQQSHPHSHLYPSTLQSPLLAEPGPSAAHLHPGQPAQPWIEPVHTLEAAYGNYINDENYAAHTADELQSGLPTPEFSWSVLGSGTSDNSSGEYSPLSIHSPAIEDIHSHSLAASHSSTPLLAATATLDGLVGMAEGAASVAGGINPLMLSPGVQPAEVPISLESIEGLSPQQLGLSGLYDPSPSMAFMPSPVSRRASQERTPSHLAPLPPLPPLPAIASKHVRQQSYSRSHPLQGPPPSARLLELTETALPRREQQGILPPAGSSASRSRTHSRADSHHARSPSDSEDDSELSEAESNRMPARSGRGVRSAAKQSAAAAAAASSRSARPAPAGVPGFAASCSQCGTEFATLHFRGKPEALNVAVLGSYLCVGCQPLSAEPSSNHHRRQSSVDVCEGYGATLSAALDRLQGTEDVSTASGPSLRRERVPSSALGLSGVSKSVFAAGASDLLCCDVCKYALARGSLLPVNPDDSIAFGVEAVCIVCRDKYRRCSDCGGGGGPRLGVGKWRAVELFPGGRKTCQLSHLRLGSLDDMSYDIHQVSTLPQKQLHTLLTACADIHYTSIVTTLATPDALESECPPARSFDEVHRLAVDGWSLYDHLLREDVEPTEGKRRYVGLRWSTPVPRKKAKNGKSKSNGAPAARPADPPLPKGSILRPGKKLVGVVIGELDLANGSLFLPLTMPTGSVGEQYDGQTMLYLALHDRIKHDIQQLNATRTIRAQLPSLREAWTVAMVRKDARGTNYLEKRRGYTPLEQYAARQLREHHLHPNRAHSLDAHHRLTDAAEAFLPPELLPGWAIFAREVAENDEWAARTTGLAAAAHAHAAAAISAAATQHQQPAPAAQKRKASVATEAAAAAKKGKKK